MSVSFVTVTWSAENILGQSEQATVSFTLNETLYDSATGNLIAPDITQTFPLTLASTQSSPLVANDSSTVTPSGSYYTVAITYGTGAQLTFKTNINIANGATQSLGVLMTNAITPGPALPANYLLLPIGNPSAGQVPETTGNSPQTTWTTVFPTPAGTPAAGTLLTATGSSQTGKWISPRVFDPMVYGATGDGVADDTTAVQAAFTAAWAVNGVVDLGNHTFKLTAPIVLNNGFNGFTVRGSGPNASGTLKNSATDMFTVQNSSSVTFDSCTLIVGSGGGHVFNAGTTTIGNGAICSGWRWLGVTIQQANAAKAIWYQVGGDFIDMVFDLNYFLSCASNASVSPFSLLAAAGAVNSVKFGRGRVTGGSSMSVPFFNFDPGFLAHVDTGIVSFNSTTTVTDANAVATDIGLHLANANVPGGSQVITAVTPGVGYTIANAATATVGGQTATISNPGWYEDILFDQVTGEVLPAGLIWASGCYDVHVNMGANWDVTASVDIYHFYKSVSGYPCRNIKVSGGRGGAVTGGANNFFADSNCTNIQIENFSGAWGTAPVISSPAGQTTLLNVTTNGTPQAQIPSLAVPQVTYITATGANTYNIPAGAQTLDVTIVGGGAGGGSGAFQNSGPAGGGSGGSAGGYSRQQFQVSQLTSPITVTVGAGGTGGSAVSSPGAGNGATNNAGSTLFGAYMWAHAGVIGNAGSATNSAGVSGGAAAGGMISGGAGGGAVNTAAAGTTASGAVTGGGGGGGGIQGTTVAAGSNGGTITNIASWGTPSAGVLAVASITNLPTSGQAIVATSNTPAVIAYTGVSAGQLTGCTYVSGGTGTVATGGAVTTAPQNGGGSTSTYLNSSATSAAGGIAGGASPTAGAATAQGNTAPGGGGGAAATSSGTGQQGANGAANTGAGGGGGGAASAGATASGAGGNGGSGYALIIAYFQ